MTAVVVHDDVHKITSTNELPPEMKMFTEESEARNYAGDAVVYYCATNGLFYVECKKP